MLRERGACALPAPLTKPSDWLSWELLRRQRPLAARPAAAQGRGSLRRRLGAGPGPRRLHRPGQASPGFPLVPRLHSDVLTTMVHPVHLEMFTFTGKEVDPSDSKDCFQELAVLRNPVICILCPHSKITAIIWKDHAQEGRRSIFEAESKGGPGH
ncbi:uncharacterized protein ACIBXB_002067 isoform 2-T2 [Morphnus guianensis]